MCQQKSDFRFLWRAYATKLKGYLLSQGQPLLLLIVVVQEYGFQGEYL
jgi:hypothetical protein